MKERFADVRSVLEIGSGTGQHAVHFAEGMPWLEWQPTDLPEEHAGIRMWIEGAGRGNVRWPLRLDAGNPDDWRALAAAETTRDEADQAGERRYDSAFTANTLHIMPWPAVVTLFEHLPDLLHKDAPFAVYGPFNYNGACTSDSNAAFDASLRERAAHMGLRNFEDVRDLAEDCGLELEADHAMPANNRLLVFMKRESPAKSDGSA